MVGEIAEPLTDDQEMSRVNRWDAGPGVSDHGSGQIMENLGFKVSHRIFLHRIKQGLMDQSHTMAFSSGLVSQLPSG